MSRLLPATASRNNSHAPVPAAWPGFTSVRTAPPAGAGEFGLLDIVVPEAAAGWFGDDGLRVGGAGFSLAKLIQSAKLEMHYYYVCQTLI